MAAQHVEKVCAKCGHARQATDVAPAWHCPACGLPYNRFQARLALASVRAKRIVVPPGPDDVAPSFLLDGSVYALALANILVIAISLYQKWPLTSLMLLYWAQSVVIGISYALRILALERYSTAGMAVNGRPVAPTPATKRQLVLFFVMMYGFFHALYLWILLVVPTYQVALDGWFFVCMGIFTLNHAWSYRYNRDLDRQGTPDIGTLMATPYLRVLPMHVMIVAGAWLGGGLFLFGMLKMVADIVMHIAEHYQLRDSSNNAP